MKLRIATVGLALISFGVACGTDRGASPAAVTQDDLIVAESPECAAVGLKVLRYLTTGDNGGDPQLDLEYASDVHTSLPEARAIADRAIVECDNASGAGAGPTATAAKASRTLDSSSAENEIAAVVTNSYGAADATNVTCPDVIPVIVNSTFECGLNVGGENKQVTVTITDVDGSYEVGRPK
jgi:hypothetical protein